jgi:hypothetical protein
MTMMKTITSDGADMTVETAQVIYEPAADTAKAFQALLAERGLGYYIVHTWVEWRRHGVIRVVPLDAKGKADWTEPAVQREVFARSTSSWGPSDSVVGRVRTGSPKHQALLNIIERIRAS